MSIMSYSMTGTKSASKPVLPKASGISEQAVSQAIRSMVANEDRQRAKTKDRGEVSGGGRKPWRQKGTGRARVGSNRSPIWRGGGITFGPDGSARPKKDVPKKLKSAVRLWLLAQRAEHGTVVVLSGTPKIERTKDGAKLVQKLGLTEKTLIVVTNEQLAGSRGLRNLADCELKQVGDVSLGTLARYGSVVATDDAWKALTAAPKAPNRGTKAPNTTPVKKKAAKPAVKPAAKKPKATKETK